MAKKIFRIFKKSMRIENRLNNSHFGARAISKTQIKQKIPFTPFYKKVDAYFIELCSQEDCKRFFKYALNYNESPGTEAMAYNFQIRPKYSQTFALTRQTDNFEYLDPTKIVGACNGSIIPSYTKPNGKFYVENLEAQSQRNLCAHHQTKEIHFLGTKIKIPLKHKGVGTELMKQLVSHLNKEPVDKIEVFSLPESMPFYRTLKEWTNNEHYFSIERRNFLEFANN